MKLNKEENGIKYYNYDSIEERDRHIRNMKAIGYQIDSRDGDLNVAYYRAFEVKVDSLD